MRGNKLYTFPNYGECGDCRLKLDLNSELRCEGCQRARDKNFFLPVEGVTVEEAARGFKYLGEYFTRKK
jgi:hypothetical protein